MTEQEINNFYQSDKQLYNIKKNKRISVWLDDLKKRGYDSYVTYDEINKLIDTIANWYIVKYSDNRLSSNEKRVVSINNELEEKMTIEQLKKRLSIFENKILDCDPRIENFKYEIIKKDKNKIDLTICFNVFEDRNPLKLVYENVQDDSFLKLIRSESNMSIYDLIKSTHFKTKSTNAYISFKRAINNEKQDRVLREEIIKLAALKVLYYRNTKLEYSIFRSKKIISDFNSFYNLNIEDDYIDTILNMDYTKINNEKGSKEEKYFVKTLRKLRKRKN